MVIKRIDDNRLGNGDFNAGNLIFFHVFRFYMLAGIDINTIIDARDKPRNLLCAKTNKEIFTERQRRIIHPEKISFERIR